jgi:hypothetical protein
MNYFAKVANHFPLVPQNTVGAIIGRQGEKIRELQIVSGASIQMQLYQRINFVISCSEIFGRMVWSVQTD